eukprot:TRINITY_DN920_c0_g1_i1.p1 TRINITY_DN920_c0_g1~~TRINITY_DN920_c0_g1_i1.p1  ORF type:complete len:751 (-),score=234.65 TRINITY_DN920_c0_g1_i1:166-2418(-)
MDTIANTNTKTNGIDNNGRTSIDVQNNDAKMDRRALLEAWQKEKGRSFKSQTPYIHRTPKTPDPTPRPLHTPKWHASATKTPFPASPYAHSTQKKPNLYKLISRKPDKQLTLQNFKKGCPEFFNSFTRTCIIEKCLQGMSQSHFSEGEKVFSQVCESECMFSVAKRMSFFWITWSRFHLKFKRIETALELFEQTTRYNTKPHDLIQWEAIRWHDVMKQFREEMQKSRDEMKSTPLSKTSTPARVESAYCRISMQVTGECDTLPNPTKLDFSNIRKSVGNPTATIKPTPRGNLKRKAENIELPISLLKGGNKKPKLIDVTNQTQETRMKELQQPIFELAEKIVKKGDLACDGRFVVDATFQMEGSDGMGNVEGKEMEKSLTLHTDQLEEREHNATALKEMEGDGPVVLLSEEDKETGQVKEVERDTPLVLPIEELKETVQVKEMEGNTPVVLPVEEFKETVQLKEMEGNTSVVLPTVELKENVQLKEMEEDTDAGLPTEELKEIIELKEMDGATSLVMPTEELKEIEVVNCDRKGEVAEDSYTQQSNEMNKMEGGESSLTPPTEDTAHCSVVQPKNEEKIVNISKNGDSKEIELVNDSKSELNDHLKEMELVDDSNTDNNLEPLTQQLDEQEDEIVIEIEEDLPKDEVNLVDEVIKNMHPFSTYEELIHVIQALLKQLPDHEIPLTRPSAPPTPLTPPQQLSMYSKITLPKQTIHNILNQQLTTQSLFATMSIHKLQEGVNRKVWFQNDVL